MHTENWFWLYTYTQMDILGQYTKTHWPEQSCQSSGYFVIYKILVQSSCFDEIFNFIYGHLVTDFSLKYDLVYFMKVFHTEF